MTVVAVYGTLRRGERNHQLMAGAEYLGSGYAAGAIHLVTAEIERAYPYPALIEHAEVEGRVVVELYRLTDPAALRALDQLEGYDPEDEAGNEFVRRSVPIFDGPVGSAAIYLYRGSPSELGERIASGDWVAR
jgi:gamma-glutamylcyclotransferase (GGCT)/AIG2-like uncharacterized protein YtfP